jgi:hypothetical protein
MLMMKGIFQSVADTPLLLAHLTNEKVVLGSWQGQVNDAYDWHLK